MFEEEALDVLVRMQLLFSCRMESRWPHGLCAGLLIVRSGLEPWPGGIVLCFWARRLLLLLCLSPRSEFNAAGNPAIDQHRIQGGDEILVVASFYCNRR